MTEKEILASLVALMEAHSEKGEGIKVLNHDEVNFLRTAMKKENKPRGRWLAERVVTKFADWFLLAIFGGIGLFVAGFWSPISDRLHAIWNSPVHQVRIIERLDELTGANRVTKQPPGMSWVREPVYKGETIELIQFLGLTQLGLECFEKEAIPLFTGEDQVTQAGERLRPTRRLSAIVHKRPIRLKVPETVPTGRVGVQLQLEFDCGGRAIFELTDHVWFLLQERSD